MSDSDSRPAPAPAAGIAAARMIIGLLQGVAGYGLWRLLADDPAPWLLRNPKGFTLLCLLVAFLPLTVLLGLGHLRRRVLAGWVLTAGVVIVLMGSHDLRQNSSGGLAEPSLQLMLSLLPMLFVAHNLVAAADASRHWWPGYGACFEAAWRSAIQLLLGIAFVAAFWAVYRLGASLFQVIGIGWLDRLAEEAPFVIVVTTTVGAAALHLADAQDRLTRGVRILGLTLLGWLTPLLAGLTTCFLLALPFTGLTPLWETGYGGPLLMTAAATLVVLINAVHQDGHAGALPLLRWSARLACWVLPVLVALAAWGLWLRIGQYGLTRNRVISVAVVLVLACYAVPYALAALRPRMRLLEPANIAVAGIAVLVVLGLNTPLADPNRLAVNSQVARLLDGKVPVEAFDFRFLQDFSRRYGRRALQALTQHPDPAIATAARRQAEPPPDSVVETPSRPRLVPYPAEAEIPPGIVASMQGQSAFCRITDCVATPVDLEGNGQRAWLVGPAGQSFLVFQQMEGEWRRTGSFNTGNCGREVATDILAGELRLLPPRWRDVEVAGHRLPPGGYTPYCD